MTATLEKIKSRLKPGSPKPGPAKAKASNLPALPAGTPFSLPPSILNGLKKVASRQWNVHLSECLLLLIGTLTALWLAQAVADWWFNLPWAVRLVLLAADLGLLGGIFYRYGVIPWTRRLTLETAALRVEKEIPAFRTSLISSVELAAAKAGCSQGSLDLVGELLTRVDLKVRSMDLARTVVKTGRLKKIFRYAAMALVAAAVATLLTWPKPPILLQRILLSSVPLPTRTIVVPVSGDESVPIGADLTLSAKAQGEIPKNGRLLLVYADKTRQEITAASSVDAPDVFSVTLRNIQQPFQYHFVLNDGTGSDFQVKAKIPPTLASFKCIQTYPGYTGMPPAEMSAGNLTLLAGSRVRIEGVATQPLKSAAVQLEGTSQKVDLKVALTDSRKMEGEFVVPKEGMTGFSIPLVNSEGIASVENTVYRIELLQDKPPTVEISVPTSARLGVLAKTKPRLVYSAKDDFGIKKLVLKYELARPAPPGGEDPSIEIGEIVLPLPEGGGMINNMSYSWDLTAQKPAWNEGCTVTYWIEATDNNNATGPGVGLSVKKSLAILSEEAKKAELLEMMGARAGEIENIYNTQKKVNEDLDSTIRKNQP